MSSAREMAGVAATLSKDVLKSAKDNKKLLGSAAGLGTMYYGYKKRKSSGAGAQRGRSSGGRIY